MFGRGFTFVGLIVLGGIVWITLALYLADKVDWSGKRVSNPQPPAWEAGALPIELLPQPQTTNIISTQDYGDKLMNLPNISGEHWINSEPIPAKALQGKVVLVDFWDYTCVNCIRTLPYLRQWWERYHELGLVIVGVHSPEFPFAKDRKNVERAVRAFKIEYPVVMDNDFAIWRSFGNRYWPAKYLFDGMGRLRYYHFGEGEYAETERVIQVLLNEIHPNANFPEPMAPIRDTDKPGAVCYPVTPELYLGYERGRLGNTEDFIPEKPHRFTINQNTTILDHIFYLDGNFTVLPWAIRYEGEDERGYGRLLLNYQGFELNLVMHPPMQSAKGHRFNSSDIQDTDETTINIGIVEILQDGQPLSAEILGEHARRDGDATIVEVNVPKMYNLVRNYTVEPHSLELRFHTPGTEAYAFTFTSCARS